MTKMALNSAQSVLYDESVVAIETLNIASNFTELKDVHGHKN